MTPTIQNLTYGLLPNQNGIELYADRETSKLYFLSNGHRKSYSELPSNVLHNIKALLEEDEAAKKDLSNLPQTEAVKKFAFCLYGGADHKPDIDEKGKLQPSDNFRCSDNCMCLKWKSKTIKAGNTTFTMRQVQIIELVGTGITNYAVACELGITESTINTTIRTIKTKLNVESTPALIAAAIRLKIIQ